MTIVLLLGSTRGSFADCVGIPLTTSSNMANSWYQALDAYTFCAYDESVTNYDSYRSKHGALEKILTVWSYHWVFLAIITPT